MRGILLSIASFTDIAASPQAIVFRNVQSRRHKVMISFVAVRNCDLQNSNNEYYAFTCTRPGNYTFRGRASGEAGASAFN